MNYESKTKKQLLDEIRDLNIELNEIQKSNSQISGQRETDKSFHRLSELFQRTLDGVAMHEIILDESGKAIDYRFLEVNEAFGKLTELVPKEIIGKKATEVIKGEEETPLIDIFEKVALTGKAVLFERYFEPIKKYFEIHAQSLGKKQFATVIRDITEEKVAEKLLQENELRFRSIFEKGPLGIFIVKVNSVVIEVNNLACDLLGYTEDEIIGKKMSAFVHQDDHQAVADKIIEAMETSQPEYSMELRFVKKSGEVIWVNQTSSLLFDEKGMPTLGVAIIEDITRRRLLEETIKSLATDLPKTYGKNFFDKVSDYLSKTLQVDFVFVGELNKQGTKVNVIGGVAHGEAMEPFDYELENTPCENVMGKEVCIYESKVQELFPKDQLLIDMGINGYIGCPLFDSNNEALGIIVVMHSQAITNPEILKSMVSIFGDRTSNEIERMHTQFKLEESRRILLESQKIAKLGSYRFDITKGEWSSSEILDVIFGIDDDFNRTFENWSSIIHPDWVEEMLEYFRIDVIEKGGRFNKEYKIKRINDREERWVHGHGELVYNSEGKPIEMLGTIQDITERKEAEGQLKDSEDRFKSLAVSTFEGIGVAKEGRIVDVNQQLTKMFGYEFNEMIGLSLLKLVHPDDHKLIQDQIQKGAEEIYEFRGIKKNGEVILLEGKGRTEKQGGELVRIAAFRDITNRKRLEQLLNAFNLAAVDMGAAMTGGEIFSAVANQLKRLEISCMLLTIDKENNQLVTEYMSYDSKIINKLEKLVGISRKGFSFPIDDVPIYKEVIMGRKTLFTDKSEQIIRQTLPKFAKKFSKQLTEILNAKIGIFAPVTVENEVIGVFSLQSNSLTKDDIQAATAFSYQLSDAWEKTILIKNLQKTVRGTIDTIAAMVEARDPYTAGHQARVSDLAVSIATEMGLSNNKIEGIRLASLVHDLGKINVPAEILSKPGKISTLEFEIIKTHPQIGYDLLKKTEFSWPIAKTILQHHEKIDGSGYPHGLKGEEILIEARVLIVADVVEAISSHRPYRPALGVDYALEHIKNESGTLFDTEVVDACLKIFKQGYNLPAFLN